MSYLHFNSRDNLVACLAHNLLTPGEAAEILGISKAAMTNIKARGTIKPAKTTMKNQVMYLRSDILKYKQYREKKTGDIPLLIPLSPSDHSYMQPAINLLSSQGLLAIFPAKIGSTVYCTGIVEGKIIPGSVEKYTNIDSEGNGDMEIHLSDDFPDIVSIICNWHEVGRTVFLSEEQAMAQLLRSAAFLPIENTNDLEELHANL